MRLVARDAMNNLIKIVGTGAVAAVVTLFVLLLSGLGTTGLADSEGNWVSLTTVQLGVNEFGFLMIIAVFVGVVVAGYAFNAIDKK
jgi:formate hydrogenlyase subunit 3/multisubunit Na+/H+ antiporter MnhD subunit